MKIFGGNPSSGLQSCQCLEIDTQRSRQRKCWSRVVNDLFSALGLDKAEWLQDIQTGECSVKGFFVYSRGLCHG